MNYCRTKNKNRIIVGQKILDDLRLYMNYCRTKNQFWAFFAVF